MRTKRISLSNMQKSRLESGTRPYLVVDLDYDVVVGDRVLVSERDTQTCKIREDVAKSLWMVVDVNELCDKKVLGVVREDETESVGADDGVIKAGAVKSWLSGVLREKGIGHAVAGQVLGIKQGAVTEWLRGEYLPTLDNLIGLLEFLGYELVISRKRAGRRPEGSIKVEL